VGSPIVIRVGTVRVHLDKIVSVEEVEGWPSSMTIVEARERDATWTSVLVYFAFEIQGDQAFFKFDKEEAALFLDQYDKAVRYVE
jgi:hypothetical protein